MAAKAPYISFYAALAFVVGGLDVTSTTSVPNVKEADQPTKKKGGGGKTAKEPIQDPNKPSKKHVCNPHKNKTTTPTFGCHRLTHGSPEADQLPF